MRDEASAAPTVHIGLLQESPLQAHEIAGRGRGGHAAPDGRLRDSNARLWRAVDAALLYGPGPAQSAVGGRLAYWPGVDQRRLADGAHQLRRRAGRQYVVARRAGDHQAAAGHGRAGAGAAGRFLPRFTWTGGSRRRHQEGAGRAGERMGSDQLGHGGERPGGQQTYRRTAATDCGDARVSIRVTQELERLRRNARWQRCKRTPCWSLSSSRAATTISTRSSRTTIRSTAITGRRSESVTTRYCGSTGTTASRRFSRR